MKYLASVVGTVVALVLAACGGNSDSESLRGKLIGVPVVKSTHSIAQLDSVTRKVIETMSP
ncbi:MAG: hypothetical protein IPQ16_05930 [Geobacteraceae bacterium]|nr:hypothetical protein [Geobacteraceae bacterium]